MWLKTDKNKEDKLNKIRNELKRADLAYYNSDTPIMSDQEYDLKAQQIGYESVGAPILNSLKKIEITPTPMLSLDKCHTAKEIQDFCKDEAVFTSLKCDGVSVRLKYKDGKLYSANTRGDGQIGSDITEHVKCFLSTPKFIGMPGEYIIDGEAVIKYYNFDKINQNNEFKNPRNTVAGSLNLLDLNIVKERMITFIAWEVITPEPGQTKTEALRTALGLGFNVVPYLIPDLKINDIDEVNKQIQELDKDIPSDGVVWKFNDYAYAKSLGATSHHFKDGIAWKPKVETVKSRLKHINWTMGRTGILTPVAVFDPVELDGSTIERASLHNYSIMRKVLGPCAYVGEPLTIFKANLIIPQILEAGPHMNYGEVIARGGVSAHDELEYCPYCHGDVQIETSDDGIQNYKCINPNCSTKLVNRLDHFCGKKGLDIKGLSKATLAKLIDWGWLDNLVDLYDLKNHRDEWIQKPGFGERSVDKILNAIEESKEVTLESFISAIGIPLIGKNVAQEICKHIISYEDLKEKINGKYDFSDWDNFGTEKCYALWKFDFSEADELANILSFKETIKPTEDLNGLIVCITGSLNLFKNRNELKEAIEAKGGKVTNSVTSKTTYLINNDIESISSKNETAKKLNIPIISEQEFFSKFLR